MLGRLPNSLLFLHRIQTKVMKNRRSCMTLADTSTARMTHLILQCHQNATKATASQFSNSTPPRLLRIATTSGLESLDRLCLGALSLETLWGLGDPKCPKEFENLRSVEFPATKKLVPSSQFHPSAETLLHPLSKCEWLKDHACGRKTNSWNYDIIYA